MSGLPTDSDIMTGCSHHLARHHVVAHEVNQPLAATVINAEAALRWLDQGPPNFDEAKKAIARVVGNSYRARDIVSCFRYMPDALTNFSDVSVNETVEYVLGLMSLDFSGLNIMVESTLDPDLPRLRADRIALERVFSNILVNSIEAMSGVDKRKRYLHVTTRLEMGAILVAIEDSGKGFDPSRVNEFFRPFLTNKHKGTGIGLSICRSIVEAHGGQLWASTKEPCGTVLRFTLPIRDR